MVYQIWWLYYTKIQLGSPPKEYYVIVDTGSNLLWVSCSKCNDCPTSSGLKIPIDFYDPSSSSTASLISCSYQQCTQYCSHSNDQCSYTIQYGDGRSGTSGYYVSDLMRLNTIGVASNSSAYVVFGCSTSKTGDLANPQRTVGGIFGFSQHGLSVIAQLSSQGLIPNAFAHCLVGSDSGGGSLVIGHIVEPNIVYTPLVPSHSHYNVNLRSISVNGQTLPIDPKTFAISESQGGTMLDSGTTLAYFPEEAYYPFVDAITHSVSQSAQTIISKSDHCYLINSSINIFPTVNLNFVGGATMVLRPQDYLLRQNSVTGADVWCIGFQTYPDTRKTILGELFLKDKIIVYDLGRQQIGWVNYDCSSYVNVSSTSSGGRSEGANGGRTSSSSSLRAVCYKLLLIIILVYQNGKFP